MIMIYGIAPANFAPALDAKRVRWFGCIERAHLFGRTHGSAPTTKEWLLCDRQGRLDHQLVGGDPCVAPFICLPTETREAKGLVINIWLHSP